LHLAVLWTFAFAKPLFDVLADSPEFFVARGNTRADIVLFAIAMVVLPPTAMLAVEALAARAPALRRAIHLGFVAVLAAAFAVQLLDDALDASGWVLIALAVALGAAAAVAYARTRAVPTILSVLGPAPLLFLVLFLLVSPVSKLVLPQEGASAADADVRSQAPVVLLLFDELDPNMLLDERQRVDATRYPNLAELAADSTVYRNATTVNSQTTLAVPALLSGMRPDADQLPIAADYPNSVFTLLGGSHDMHVTETATEVCPERLCGSRSREPTGDRLRALAEDLGIVSLHLVSPEQMEADLPAVDQTFGDFGAGGRDQAGQPDVPSEALRNRPGQFEALLRGIRPDRRRPSFHFLHSALPHIPWQYLPSGKQYINSGPDDYPGLKDELWSAEPVTAQLGLQRHLLQVGYIDRLVGRLTERLRSTGLYERAMVIVTADHGVSYRPGEPRRAPTEANISDIAAVPLLIKYPGEQGGRFDDSMVRTIDIVPTIADRLGAELPWDADGRPIGAGAREPDVAVGAGTSGKDVTLPFPEFALRRVAGLQEMTARFGSDDGGRRLYATGPHWDLLGRRPASLASAPALGRVELDSAHLLADFRPDSRLVPSFVSGRVVGELRPGTSVAVALGGRIRSVAQVFAAGDELRLAALVPAEAFEAGANSIDLFAVRPGGRLAPLATGRPESYRLVEEDGEWRVEGGGVSAQLQEGAIEGFVDRYEIDDQGARVGGWAVAADGPKPAGRLLVFAGDELIAQGEPNRVRPDIVQRYGTAAVRRSGYELLGGGQGAELSDLRVIAISGDIASELPVYRP
jgi:hypothetical protein